MEPCIFCGRGPVRREGAHFDGTFHQCPECGPYYTTSEFLANTNNLTLIQRSNAVVKNIQAQFERNTVVWVSDDYESEPGEENSREVYGKVKYLNTPLRHGEKKDQLLLVLAHRAENLDIMSAVKLSWRDFLSIGIISESEANEFLASLMEETLVISTFRTPRNSAGIASDHWNRANSLTARGWQKIDELRKGKDSNEVFIAIEFAFKDAHPNLVPTIQETCKKYGLDANIVPDHHDNYIMDEIIRRIKRAKIVIAEFSYQNNGVYFEAGLARGYGKHVIHLVSKEYHKLLKENASRQSEREGDGLDETTIRRQYPTKLHFDIEQIRYISWQDEEDLRQQLDARLDAILDQG